MSLVDIVLLTLLNMIICIILPRLISIILDYRKSQSKIVTSDICHIRSREKTKRFYYFTSSTSARS